MLHSGLLAITLAAQSSLYAIDGVTLGENVSIVISKRGAPSESNGRAFTWVAKNGEKLTLLAEANGTITVIDLIARPGEKREIQVPGQSVVLGETGHVNYVAPPESRSGDACGAGLLGSPCEAIRLNNDEELIMNFGMNNGLADWGLSEVILANRDVLISAGRIIAQ